MSLKSKEGHYEYRSGKSRANGTRIYSMARTRLASAVLAALFSIPVLMPASTAIANPELDSIVSQGIEIDISTDENGALRVTTGSTGAVIDWKTFSIGAEEAAQFIQKNADSRVLNRVTGGELSNILGSLSSNGQLYLINPNGILVGQGATIDASGLVLSTLNLSPEDFAAGKLNFQGDGGQIVNQGDIKVGGNVYLIAGSIDNQGRISTGGGNIFLVAGNNVNIDGTRASASGDGSITSTGSLQAGEGLIGMLASRVQTSGSSAVHPAPTISHTNTHIPNRSRPTPPE